MGRSPVASTRNPAWAARPLSAAASTWRMPWVPPCQRDGAEVGDQQAAARVQHPEHLAEGVIPLRLGDVVHGQGAGHHVERVIRPHQILSHADGERAVGRGAAGGVPDRRAGRVDAGHPPVRGHRGGEQAGLVAAVTADVQDLLPRVGAAERHETAVDPGGARPRKAISLVISYVRVRSIVSPRGFDVAFRTRWSTAPLLT